MNKKKWRELNSQICDAIDMGKLGAVLTKMHEECGVDEKLCRIYFNQASVLMEVIRRQHFLSSV